MEGGGTDGRVLLGIEKCIELNSPLSLSSNELKYSV